METVYPGSVPGSRGSRVRPLLFLALLSALASTGCGTEPPATAGPAQPNTPANATATHFDPTSCGIITGAVTWVGPIPNVPPAIQVLPRSDGSGLDLRHAPMATAPRIDRITRGLDGAVIYLREVNPATAKPWDLPPAAVEFRGTQLVIKQGDRVARSGFVRRGDSVEMRSAEPRLHILRGRGAEHFALAFPKPDQPLTRKFDTCGRVELTNAAGYCWQSADLFVCDHPYYTVCNAEGRYKFTHVPAGQYDLVAWHPNWNVVRTERNPETGIPSRVVYAPPLETSRPVFVTPGRMTLANLTFPE